MDVALKIDGVNAEDDNVQLLIDLPSLETSIAAAEAAATAKRTLEDAASCSMPPQKRVRAAAAVGMVAAAATTAAAAEEIAPAADTAAPEKSIEKKKSKKPDDAGADQADESEVLSAGEIMRAPLPMISVLAMEDASGVQQGAYFIELMRRRLQGLLAVQEKWISRLCNQKHARHVDTQLRIRDFMQAVIESYETRFGKPSETIIAAAPIRRRRASSSSSSSSAAAAAASAAATTGAAGATANAVGQQSQKHLGLSI